MSSRPYLAWCVLTVGLVSACGSSSKPGPDAASGGAAEAGAGDAPGGRDSGPGDGFAGDGDKGGHEGGEGGDHGQAGEQGSAGSAEGGDGSTTDYPLGCAVRADFVVDAMAATKTQAAALVGREPVSQTFDLIDNLDDGDLAIPATNGRVGGWFSYGDPDSVVVGPTAVDAKSGKGLELSGTLAVSALLGVALNAPTTTPLPYDLTAYEGVHFWAAGLPGSTLRVTVRTSEVEALADGGTCDPLQGSCEDAFGTNFALDTPFHEFFIPFQAMTQLGWGQPVLKDFSHGIAVQFHPQGAASTFDFVVDELSLYGSGVSDSIRVNQLGYLANGVKRAVVVGASSTSFSIVDASDAVVQSGSLGAAGTWAPSGESGKIADFSELVTPGSYRVKVGTALSNTFVVGDDVFDDLGTALVKAYYFNRASTSLTAPYAGVYVRPAGHPDTAVLIHASAASTGRPEGTLISAPRGWYDAGDYGKYVVNASVSTTTLLAAYEHYPERFAKLRTNIPESGSKLPDILSEARYNLDWLTAMQDPGDGGVYHELVTAQFAGFVMPASDTAPRYVLAKTTSAALDFAATLAHAARTYAPFDAAFACKAIEAAERAYAWAEAHPSVAFKLPSGFSAGAYEPTEFGYADYKSEFYWAAAELFVTTGNPSYRVALEHDEPATLRLPGWISVEAFGALAVLEHPLLFTEAGVDAATAAWLKLADDLVAIGETSSFGVPLDAFPWGSNALVANSGLVLLVAHEQTGDAPYLDAAVAAADYLLGRNGVSKSFVSGYGDQPPMNLHHRASAADGIVDPIPGFVVGGPNDATEDRGPSCVYPSQLPAKGYLDATCAYASVEVAINWNAPAVYLINGLQAELGAP